MAAMTSAPFSLLQRPLTAC